MVHGQQAGKIKSLLILSINRVKYKRLKKKNWTGHLLSRIRNKWIKELEAKIKPKELRLEG